jgi:hypothetical protein
MIQRRAFFSCHTHILPSVPRVLAEVLAIGLELLLVRLELLLVTFLDVLPQLPAIGTDFFAVRADLTGVGTDFSAVCSRVWMAFAPGDEFRSRQSGRRFHSELGGLSRGIGANCQNQGGRERRQFCFRHPVSFLFRGVISGGRIRAPFFKRDAPSELMLTAMA